MKFEERQKAFEDKLLALQEEYGIVLYPANVVMRNGEVTTVIKVRDTKEELTEKNEDNTTK